MSGDERERMAAERAQRRYEYELFGAPDRPSVPPSVRSHKKRPGRTAGQAEFIARRRLAAEVRARSSDAAHAADYPDPDDEVTISDIRWQEPR